MGRNAGVARPGGVDEVDVAGGGPVVDVAVVPGDVVGVASEVVGGTVAAEVDVGRLVVVPAGEVVVVVDGPRVKVVVEPPVVVVDERPVVVVERPVVADGGGAMDVDDRRVVLVGATDEGVVDVPGARVPMVPLRVVEVTPAMVLDVDVVGRETAAVEACEVGGAIRGSGGAVGTGVPMSAGPRSRW